MGAVYLRTKLGLDASVVIVLRNKIPYSIFLLLLSNLVILILSFYLDIIIGTPLSSEL